MTLTVPVGSEGLLRTCDALHGYSAEDRGGPPHSSLNISSLGCIALPWLLFSLQTLLWSLYFCWRLFAFSP